MANRVRLQATELDVHVDGMRVGMVTDCGDCWRASVYRSRGRSAKHLGDDFDTRADAVRSVVAARLL